MKAKTNRSDLRYVCLIQPVKSLNTCLAQVPEID